MNIRQEIVKLEISLEIDKTIVGIKLVTKTDKTNHDSFKNY